jgi:hypothetical protein
MPNSNNGRSREEIPSVGSNSNVAGERSGGEANSRGRNAAAATAERRPSLPRAKSAAVFSILPSSAAAAQQMVDINANNLQLPAMSLGM